MNQKQMQDQLRAKLETRRSVTNPIMGRTYIGVVPVGQLGWVHGRLGVYISINLLRDLETGEEFRVQRICQK